MKGLTARLVSSRYQVAPAPPAKLADRGGAHRVVGGEEVAAVIASRGETAVQQVGDQPLRVLPGFLGQGRNDGVVKAQLVVFDIVAVHLDGGFPILALHLVGLGFQGADLTVPDPFPHHGEVQEELIVHDPGVGRDRHGHLLVPGLSLLEGGIEDRGETGIKPCQSLLIDDHLCTSFSVFRSFFRLRLIAFTKTPKTKTKNSLYLAISIQPLVADTYLTRAPTLI